MIYRQINVQYHFIHPTTTLLYNANNALVVMHEQVIKGSSLAWHTHQSVFNSFSFIQLLLCFINEIKHVLLDVTQSQSLPHAQGWRIGSSLNMDNRKWNKDLGHFVKAMYRKLGLFWQLAFLCSLSQL